jgi:hypothetical protein
MDKLRFLLNHFIQRKRKGGFARGMDLWLPAAGSPLRQPLSSNALTVSTPPPWWRRTRSHPTPTPHAAANSRHPRPRNAPSSPSPISTPQTLPLPSGTTTWASAAPMSSASSSGMRCEMPRSVTSSIHGLGTRRVVLPGCRS